ncbi:RmlC-like cupin [Trichoderma longibrachiatum ATCC 18648]|uniref:RmlC-like cupin n=1 Tax=Trichoderma longibrachiatum ATCC 18648 TaxID=983965 RepID=A0A2T4CBN4_TRILO|nr:RmlC-like cupin [Trichoderma longibrachiatum ATCC 18648]
MKTSPLFLTLTLLTLPLPSSPSPSPLIVDKAPSHLRPYILPRHAGHALKLTTSGQTIRLSITTTSSAGAFSLVQHYGKSTSWTSARPHTHKHVHEHFYCSKGRVELWTKKNVTDDAVDEARVLTQGDFGTAPPGTIHTFQHTAPDSQLTHIFNPGGFEALFEVFSLGDFESPHGAPYELVTGDERPFGDATPEQEAQLNSLDLWLAKDDVYVPRRDFVNGTAGDARLNWHDGDNSLSNDPSDPYYIAKDHGPRYLHSENGYKVIQPLLTAVQTPFKNLTIGTITLSPRLSGEKANVVRLDNHFAIQMDEGQLALTVQGYEREFLLQGDVAFIPAGVRFEYFATVPMTRFLYVNAGERGYADELLERAVPWDFAVYPA